MYTIKRAAEITGVPAATLRAWERRYEVIQPERTDSGYRLYDDESVGRIRAMAELVADGWSAGTAAAEVTRRREEPAQPGVVTAVPTTPPTPENLAASTRELLDAAAATDPGSVARVLDERFGSADFEAVVDDWLLPTLEQVGNAWADGRITVAGEHLVAHAVLRRLAAAYDAAGSHPDGPAVVIGLPAGAHHELGVFAFAVALRRLGARTVYLGPDLPTPAWSATLDTHSSAHVVLSAPRDADVSTARRLVGHIRSTHPEATVFLGGGHQEGIEDAGVVHLGHAIGPAATQVAAALGA